MALAHSPKIITNGLALSLDAANPKSYTANSSTILNMINPSTLTGTIINSPAYSTENNGVLNFNRSSNNYISFSNNAAFNSQQITLNITLYKPTWSNSSERLYSKTQSGSYALTTDYIANNLSLVFLIAGSYRAASYLTSNINTEWNIFTGTCDGRYIKLYVNGNLVSTYDHGSTAGITHSTAPFMIGAEPTGSEVDNSYVKFDGKFANFMLYNRTLGDDEIKQNFNALRGRFGI